MLRTLDEASEGPICIGVDLTPVSVLRVMKYLYKLGYVKIRAVRGIFVESSEDHEEHRLLP